MKNSIKIIMLGIFVSFLSFSCNAQNKEEKQFTVKKSEAEWRQELSPDQFYVLREKGTERPFTSEYNKNYKDGVYLCAACENPLYKSEHKFDSGTGWPSFDRAIENSISTGVDYDLGYARNELLCGNCGGHLGHVFGDGPANTTGQRHCINGVSLKFIENK